MKNPLMTKIDKAMADFKIAIANTMDVCAELEKDIKKFKKDLSHAPSLAVNGNAIGEGRSSQATKDAGAWPIDFLDMTFPSSPDSELYHRAARRSAFRLQQEILRLKNGGQYGS